MPAYLVDWISNFIHTREIALAYPGSLRTQQEVNKKIPQGSPLSPLLFILYVRSLHINNECPKNFTSYYVDDFQVTVASNSWYRNTRIVEKKIGAMNCAAASLGLLFSIAKTELIH